MDNSNNSNPTSPQTPASTPGWPTNPAEQLPPSGPVELQDIGEQTYTDPLQAGSTSSSPLNNPWSTPAQSPAIDNQPPPINPIELQNIPADISEPSQPTWMPITPLPETSPGLTESTPLQSATPSPAQSEPAPTDLSHLITNNSRPDPESLIVPPTSPEVSTTLPAENHKDIPKWLIGLGVGLLLIVTGASAYFILGIGQPPKTSSIPAEQTEKPTIKAPAPIATPVASQPSPAPADSSNPANFGQLEGGNSPEATSAADLLRQRR